MLLASFCRTIFNARILLSQVHYFHPLRWQTCAPLQRHFRRKIRGDSSDADAESDADADADAESDAESDADAESESDAESDAATDA